jgi:2-hydroxychromene-2-carboxylate isomerase
MPLPLQRHALRALTAPRTRDLLRGAFALARRVRGHRPVVHYFHQPDDPYSHLAAQALVALRARYAIELRLHLVAPPTDAAAPERARLIAWSLRDARRLAARHGLSFPATAAAPTPARTRAGAAALLDALDDVEAFASAARAVGEALFTEGALPSTGAATDEATDDAASHALARGDALRARSGHYLGATFHFEGEWYWGVDRLHHIEARLHDAGLARAAERGPLFPPAEPRFDGAPVSGARPTLQLFASLRSPYTYLALERARRLASTYGATLRLRYVLPMVMRGLPVPRAKQIYIVLDAKREAERLGLPFGDICDPVGRGAERGLAVLHRAVLTARADDPAPGFDFFESFCRGVWAEGVDSTTDRGLKRLAARVGLNGSFVDDALSREDWRAAAEANRAALFARGLWGAPTFQVDERPALWGQDRLWAVEEDLKRAGG